MLAQTKRHQASARGANGSSFCRRTVARSPAQRDTITSGSWTRDRPLRSHPAWTFSRQPIFPWGSLREGVKGCCCCCCFSGSGPGDCCLSPLERAALFSIPLLPVSPDSACGCCNSFESDWWGCALFCYPGVNCGREITAASFILFFKEDLFPSFLLSSGRSPHLALSSGDTVRSITGTTNTFSGGGGGRHCSFIIYNTNGLTYVIRGWTVVLRLQSLSSWLTFTLSHTLLQPKGSVMFYTLAQLFFKLIQIEHPGASWLPRVLRCWLCCPNIPHGVYPTIFSNDGLSLTIPYFLSAIICKLSIKDMKCTLNIKKEIILTMNAVQRKTLFKFL